MNLVLIIAGIVIWGWLAVIYIRRYRERKAFEKLSITPEALHQLISSDHRVQVLDVRQPLDLLADSEIIEGALRLAPADVERDPSLIPVDKELVVYCTCPSDKTSRAIAARAQAAAPQIDAGRVKFLKGGLAAWKAKGYPVVPYDKTFRLDTGT
jgi:rhodanese-related sulfurtransferase